MTDAEPPARWFRSPSGLLIRADFAPIGVTGELTRGAIRAGWREAEPIVTPADARRKPPEPGPPHHACNDFGALERLDSEMY